jgi:tetratricopeptide (TPR) repeat protein
MSMMSSERAHPWRSIALLLAVVILCACATQGEHEARLSAGQITTEMLLDASPLMMGFEVEDRSQIDVLELSPEMIAFVDENTRDYDGSDAKLRSLLRAVMGTNTFKLIYDDQTRTARETFEDRQGNCLSFTNMFVAMARQAGIDARYQEVEIAPLWSLVGHSFLLNQHINVAVHLKTGAVQVIDFNITNFGNSKDTRVISDNRARAHYFNNIGAEEMLGGDTQSSFANFRQSVLEDETFSPGWVNLGNLYRRDGYSEYAEATYLHALDTDDGNVVAMSNLANLYQEQGHEELAEQYRERVEFHRMRNPYYLFLLATETSVSGDYRAAIKYMKRAIRLRDDEPRFYALLSYCYLMSGEDETARYWMGKAEAAAVEQNEKQRYQDKLDLLMRLSSGN